MVNVAQCMRRHGIPNFPDPRTSIPSNPRAAVGGTGVISNIDGRGPRVPGDDRRAVAAVHAGGGRMPFPAAQPLMRTGAPPVSSRGERRWRTGCYGAAVGGPIRAANCSAGEGGTARAAAREADQDREAAAGGELGGDRRVVGVGDRLHDREPEAEPVGGGWCASRRGAGRARTAGRGPRRDRRAAVGHAEDRVAVRRCAVVTSIRPAAGCAGRRC